MEFRYKTKRVSTLGGDYLVITDKKTNVSVNLLEVQAVAIMLRFNDNVMEGSFPQVDYSIKDKMIKLQSVKDKEKTVFISLDNLKSIVFENIETVADRGIKAVI